MLVDFIPIVNGLIADDKVVELPKVADNIAYQTAHDFHEDKEYVENMLDGRGWIEMMVPGNHGMIRYRQEPNADKE